MEAGGEKVNRVIFELAYKNIRKYRNFWFFSGVMILLVTVLFQGYMIIGPSQNRVMQEYNDEVYGHWYYSFTIDDDFSNYEYPLHFEYQMSSIDSYKDIQYAYLYEQEPDIKGNRIASVSDNFYELCHIDLLEGSFPIKDNEIAVDEAYAKDKNITVGQEIIIEKVTEKKQYRVCGIVKNSQSDLFPTFYNTNQDKENKLYIYVDSGLLIYDNQPDYSLMVSYDAMKLYGKYQVHLMDFNIKIADVNPYGRNHGVSVEDFEISRSDAYLFMMTFGITAILLYMVSATNNKRRLQEFALLRGIGATNNQLYLLCFYEIFICGLFTVVIGSCIGFMIAYTYMNYLKAQTGIYYLVFDIIMLVLYAFIILSVSVIVLIIPAIHSSNRSLTGTFEGNQFQYFEVRNRKLTYQNPFRLGLRELNQSKRIFIFLIVLVITVGTQIFTHLQAFGARGVNTIMAKSSYYYVEYWGPELVDSTYLNQYFDDYNYYRISFEGVPATYDQDEQSSVVLSALDKIDKEIPITGDMPTKDNEVLVNQNWINPGNISIGDEIVIGDETFYVVGEIITGSGNFNIDNPNLLIYAGGIFMLPNVFDQYLDTYDHSQQTIAHIYYQDGAKQRMIEGQLMNDENVASYSDHVILDSNQNNNFIYDIVVVTIWLFSMMLGYQMNKNEMLDHINDYMVYRMIGIDKKSFYLKQSCKGLLLGSIVCGLCYFWYQIQQYQINYDMFVLGSLMVIIGSVLIYILPLKTILKEDMVDYLSHR